MSPPLSLLASCPVCHTFVWEFSHCAILNVENCLQPHFPFTISLPSQQKKQQQQHFYSPILIYGSQWRRRRRCLLSSSSSTLSWGPLFLSFALSRPSSSLIKANISAISYRDCRRRRCRSTTQRTIAWQAELASFNSTTGQDSSGAIEADNCPALFLSFTLLEQGAKIKKKIEKKMTSAEE